jgi:polar amino acid transport system substrate-binding protein
MYHFASKCCLILAGLCFITPSYASNAEQVKVYTYHEKPPYFMPATENSSSNYQGIYADFVDYLNAKQSEYVFELSFLPRIRLENLLTKNSLDGIVIGVNPRWFADTKREKYLWTNAIMKDKNVFLVNEKNSYTNYIKNEQFIGSKMALARGGYHKGITELINQGKIKVSLTNTDIQNLEMLVYNRVDVTIMSPLTVGYILKNNDFKKNFRILAEPHEQYERMILIPKNQAAIFPTLSKIVQQSESDKLWKDKFKIWSDDE